MKYSNLSEARRLQKQCPCNKSVTKILLVVILNIYIFIFLKTPSVVENPKGKTIYFALSGFFLIFSSVSTDFSPFLLISDVHFENEEDHSCVSSSSSLCFSSSFSPSRYMFRLSRQRPREQHPRSVHIFNVLFIFTAPSWHRRAHSSDVSVTRNLRSPRVWSVAVSSRGGRGGNRKTSQSFLCLKKEMRWKIFDTVHNITS